MNKHDMARERLIFKCIMFYDNFYFKGRNIGIDFNCDGKPDMNLINNLTSIQLKVFKSDHPLRIFMNGDHPITSIEIG